MGDSNIGPSIPSVRISASGKPVQITFGHLPPNAPKPKLFDQVRLAIRTRHLSSHTEQAYIGWIKRFIFFHNTRHPAEMGGPGIGRFLSSLATDARVSASTQKQALNALLFLYTGTDQLTAA